MKSTHLVSTILISTVILFSGCSEKTYSYQIDNNTYTSSSNSRANVLEEASETCEDLNLKIKVLEERVIDDETHILKYKCLDDNSIEYKKN